jgi:hypothetical protein
VMIIMKKNYSYRSSYNCSFYQADIIAIATTADIILLS